MKVTVCMGSQCVAMGAMNLVAHLEDLKNEVPDLEVENVRCLGVCKNDTSQCPVVKIGNTVLKNATSQDVMAKIMESREA